MADSAHLPDDARHAAAARLRAGWHAASERARESLASSTSGLKLLRELSRAMDQLLKQLWQEAQAACGAVPRAMLAVGGYGRREQFFHSDLDLLILLPDDGDPAAARAAQWLLYALWDSGLKVSQQVGTLDDILALAARDVAWRTSLLDSRALAGDAEAQPLLQRRLREEVLEGALLDFVEAKLSERERRHHKLGDSRYLLEPNVKDGKGALRDLHTLYWLARATRGLRRVRELVESGMLSPSDMRAYVRAAEFLSLVRLHLHALAGRAEERLTFEYQRPIAAALGFRGDTPNAMVERFMKRYFQIARSVGRLTRAVCTALEEDKQRKPRGMLAAQDGLPEPHAPFGREGQRLAFTTDPASDPALLVLLFDEARRTGRDIHPRALQQVAQHAAKLREAHRRDPRVAAAFLNLLTAPDAEMHLRRMNEAELLARLVPEFAGVVGQMQFDRYHTYTVDEHILVAVGNLHAIARGAYGEMLPLASRVVAEFATDRVLFLSMFCHDLAKGTGGNHQEKGGTLATRIAERCGFDRREQQEAAWLVVNHQLLTEVVGKRDLTDPRVVLDVAEHIQSVRRLRMLLLMTVADILAVGPHVWNGWKGALLRDLHHRVEQTLLTGTPPSGQKEEPAARLRRLDPALRPEEAERLAALAEPRYWHAQDDAALGAQLALLTAIPAPITLHWAAREDATELTLRTADRPGLFALLTGAFAACGANILRCQIQTLADGTALDQFLLQDRHGKPFASPAAQRRLAALLERALTAEGAVEEALLAARQSYRPRLRLYDTPPSLHLDLEPGGGFSVLEITAPDRLGLLHRIAEVLAAQKLNVARAYVATYGEQAVDVFYLKNAYGLPLAHPLQKQALIEALQQALREG